MRHLLCLLFLCCTLALGSAEPRVLLMSHDGLGAEQVSAATTPRLWALAKRGLRGASLPPHPSTTFNGHATLATGCLPEHHGILGNSFVDPELGFVPHTALARYLQREPLWVAATRAGVRTAVYQWPCGEAAWRDQPAWRQEPFRSGGGDAEAMAFVDQALTDGARLVMAYFPGTDEAGHLHGPGSPVHRARLQAIDRALAPWVGKLLKRHTDLRIVFTADHGMVRVPNGVSLATLLKDERGRWIAHGRSATLTLEDPLRAPALIAKLRAAGLDAWPSAATLPHPRAGQVLVQAPAESWLSAGATDEDVAKETYGRAGAHGSMRDEAALRACLLVFGAGEGELGMVSMTQVAPTVAAWLGIRWREAPDGKPWGILPNAGKAAK